MKSIIISLFLCASIGAVPISRSPEFKLDECVQITNQPDIINNIIPTNSSNSTACKTCHLVADFIRESNHITNSTLNAIEKFVDATCCAFGIKIQCDICKNVTNMTQQIYNDIEKGMTDTQLCEKLGFCDTLMC